VTGKPTPPATARRKRRGETRGGFLALARAVTVKIKTSISRRVSPLSPPAPEQPPGPSVSIFTAMAFLSGTLDWMNPYWDDLADDALHDEQHTPEYDSLSPHP